jgi:hypothetical protein
MDFRIPSCIQLQSQLGIEWQLTKKNWKRIILICIITYLHNIATNIAYYLQNKRRHPQLLFDIGFELFPENEDFHETNELIFSVFIGFAVFIILVLSFFSAESQSQSQPQPLDNNRHQRQTQTQRRNKIYTTTIALRAGLTLSTAVVLRSLTFLSTALPSPAHHCRYNSAVFHPPKSISAIFSTYDSVDGCGDLIFSGHTTLVMSIVITTIHYSHYMLPRFLHYLISILLLCMTISLAILIIVARNHYTVDVVVALYVVPLVYYFVWHQFPDLKVNNVNDNQEEEE